MTKATKAGMMRETTRAPSGASKTPSLQHNWFELRALRNVALTGGAWLVAALGAFRSFPCSIC